MRVLKLSDSGAVARACADVVAESVARRSGCVLGLPTGKTVLPVYDELAARAARGELDLSACRAFNLDELLLPAGHPATFRAYMERHAGERIGLDAARCDIPRSTVTGEEAIRAECARYELAIAARGGFDLALLGVGADGHVAYNLPGPAVLETHAVELGPELADELDVPSALRPLRAITVGLGTLLAARRIVLMATSADKSRAVGALLAGAAADPLWPCSFLARHPALDVMLTPEAAPAGESAP